MPYKNTLTDQMSGNIPEAIHECLYFLYNEAHRGRGGQFRVSIIYGSGRSQISIGDDLELADPDTCKVRKKRWWEHKVANQPRLPFSLYQPAKILTVSTGQYGNSFELQIEYKDDEGTKHCVVTRFNMGDGLQASGRGIKAIKVHRIERQWFETEEEKSDPFFENRKFLLNDSDLSVPREYLQQEESFSPRSEIQSIEREYERSVRPSGVQAQPSTMPPHPSLDRCAESASRAAVDGLVVSQTGYVYNRRTCECVGYDLIMSPDEVTEWGRTRYSGRFRLLSGELIHFNTLEPVTYGIRIQDRVPVPENDLDPLRALAPAIQWVADEDEEDGPYEEERHVMQQFYSQSSMRCVRHSIR